MNNDSIEKSRSVVPHPLGISKEKSVVHKKYKGSDVFDNNVSCLQTHA